MEEAEESNGEAAGAEAAALDEEAAAEGAAEGADACASLSRSIMVGPQRPGGELGP